MKEIELHIKRLKEKLKAWSKEYYLLNGSTVSDQVYDATLNELIKLEAEYPELVTPDSPTQQVGAKTDERFKKFSHEFPMLSLGNAFDFDDLKNFDDQIKRALALSIDAKLEYVSELKIDGLSIALIYDQGKLVRALTRGDGKVGEDVTHNILTIENIPKTISCQQRIEFRGEVYMPLDKFNAWNASATKAEKLANPRNAAAGSIRQLDSKVAKSRQLAAFIYAIPNPLDFELHTHSDVLSFIKKQGFAVNEHSHLNSSLEELKKQIQTYINIRESLNYDIDGVVIKLNNIDLWEDVGFTVKAPKFMIAYKFPEEVGETKLLKIFPTIGRTGRVTYNAKLMPLRLAGTTVTAATLHNADYVREIGINVGDIVKVKKAGEIIPKVLGVALKNNSEPWQEATACPACGHALVRQEALVDQYCVNEECPQRNIARLEHFTSRNAMDIRELSIKTIELFVHEGLITDLPSIFALPEKREQILQLPGFQAKSVANIIKAIEDAKKRDLGKFLFGLGIRHLGEKLASILAKRFGSLENIMNASFEDLNSIREFGEKVSLSIVKYFADEANRRVLAELKEFDLSFNETAAPQSSKLINQTFVITGSLSKERSYFKSLIESHGGNVASAVSRNTNFLLAGEAAGSKLDKAKELEVKIISEQDLNKMIGGNNG